MRPKNCLIALLLVLCVSVAVSLNAQESPQTNPATGQSTSAPPHETKVGDYVAAGSIEAGYRFVDVSGAQFPCLNSSGVASTCNYGGAWNTFEDLREGPRIFEQSLSLRSEGNTGVLFDNLFVSSFGWGGDPENVARLRMNKHKAYDFSVLFRRDYQRFDYNILANPLNPASSTPNIPILTSPHLYDTVRRMSDVNLTLAPSSPISIRLGYNRVRIGGSSFSTFHMPTGTDINPEQRWNFTSDGYRGGIDLKFMPKTTLSFDAVVDTYKQDTALALRSFPVTIGGVPANEGISWNTLAGQPCPVTALGTATCNLAFSFGRQDRYRTTAPTLRASLETHYWRRLDFTARGTYGWADLDSRFLQSWAGLVRAFPGADRLSAQDVANSPLRNRRITGNADVGATFHLTDHVRITDTFRYVNQRMPLFGINIVTSTTATDAFTPIGTTSAGSAITRGLFTKTKLNETDLEFDLGRFAGVTIGYRYTHRDFLVNGEAFDIDTATGERLDPNEGPSDSGTDHFKMPEHTAIGALYFRPNERFRVNFDAEASSAGITYITDGEVPGTFDTFTGLTTFTRITPRHQQQYRARATYQPQRHVSLSANLNIWEQRNSLQDIQYRFHNRNFGVNADISPNDRVLVDLAYNYQGYLQNDLICFVASGAPATGSFPGLAVGSAGLCALDPTYLGVPGDYGNKVHFGSAMFRVKPVKRVTLSAGYSLISDNGTYTQLNALIPSGPTRFNYHRPLAALDIDVAKGLGFKGAWNYYDYNEKGSNADIFGSGGPTLPRDFHANTGTISLRYSF